MSLVVDQHRQYFADVTRVDLFQRALAETIRPGAVVVDVGCGTGILALLALACGAGRVYAIESTGMIEVARAIVAANGAADRIHLVFGHSLETTLPERADVVVADVIGRFGFEAGFFDVYPDAVGRFLKPGGAAIPSQITLMGAPVEREDMRERVEFWRSSDAPVVLRPAFEWAVNTGYPVNLERGDLLTDPVVLATARAGDAPAVLRGTAEAVVTRAGVLHGFGGWFEARLSPGVTMTNSPLAAGRIRRRNVFLPVEPAMPVVAGDRVRVTLRILPADVIVSWRVEVIDSAGDVRARASHSTLKGMLISRDDLRRARPDFVPSLTPRGMARLTTLQLCDGGRPLCEIERLVHDRHPELFASRGEAEAFVAEVVAGYTRAR